MKKGNLALSVIFMVCLGLISCSATSTMIPSNARQAGFIDFSNWPTGSWYTLDKMSSEWNPRRKNGDEAIDFKGIIHNRAMVVENAAFGGKALKVFLPGGKISPAESGAQIFGFIGGNDQVYFEASIYLPLDFECGREIKIPPGIYGGWQMATGGKKPDGLKIGPSVRAVLQNCQAKSYIYHLNQSGDNGDGVHYRHPTHGDKFTWRYSNGQPVVMNRGVRHDIMFYVKMNTPSKKDGVHRVWYDGNLVLSLDNLEFRKSPALKFDTVGAEIFRGGNNQSYATKNDNTLDVGNFRLLIINK